MIIYVVTDCRGDTLRAFESLETANGFALDRSTDGEDWVEENNGDFSNYGPGMMLALRSGYERLYVERVELELELKDLW